MLASLHTRVQSWVLRGRRRSKQEKGELRSRSSRDGLVHVQRPEGLLHGWVYPAPLPSLLVASRTAGAGNATQASIFAKSPHFFPERRGGRQSVALFLVGHRSCNDPAMAYFLLLLGKEAPKDIPTVQSFQ